MSRHQSSQGKLLHFPSGYKSEHAFKRVLSHQRSPMCLIIVSSTCGYCSQMKPELDKLSKKISSSRLPTTAVVDIETARSSSHPALQTIDRVPSILSLPVRRSEPTIMHTGDRTAESLMSFIKSTSEAPVTDTKSTKSKTRRNSKSSQKKKTAKKSKSKRKSLTKRKKNSRN